MRHVKSFAIEEGQNQEDLCNQINQYASDNNLSVFSVTFNHFRSAFVIFDHDVQACEAPRSLQSREDYAHIVSQLSKMSKREITISMGDIKRRFDDAVCGIEVAFSYKGTVCIGCGDSTDDAIANLITNLEKETGCRVLVNCGSNGKQDASFFMKRHDKLVADRSKH